MDFAVLSAQRYSLRKFSDRPVETEALSAILEAGRSAPTAHNNQPQRTFVLQTRETLEKADGCVNSHFHPPVMLIWLTTPRNPGSGRGTARSSARWTRPLPPPR